MLCWLVWIALCVVASSSTSCDAYPSRTTLAQSDRFVMSVVFSPDGLRLASGSSRVIQIWDWNSQTSVQNLTGHTENVGPVAWHSSGLLASGSNDDSVKIWDDTGACLQTLIGHTGNVLGVNWSPMGNMLASGSADYSVLVWNASSGSILMNLTNHTNEVASVTWSPTEPFLLASASRDFSVIIWNITDGSVLQTLIGHTNEVMSAEWSPNGLQIASASYDKTIRLWDAQTGQVLKILSGHDLNAQVVNWSPDGTQLASGSWDTSIKIWDVASGLVLETLQGHAFFVTNVRWSPDGTMIASSAWDGTVKLWEFAPGSRWKTFLNHSDVVTSAIWSPDGSKMASGSWDTRIVIWDVPNGKPIRTLLGHTEVRTFWTTTITGGISMVAWSPDVQSALLASASDDKTVKIWNTTNGTYRNLVTRGPTPYAYAKSISWSPDGALLASGWNDGWIFIHNVASETLVANLTGHTDEIRPVAFSPDGTKLAAAGKATIVFIFDVASGSLVKKLNHSVHVTSLAWSPDGMKIASSAFDPPIKIWDAGSGVLLKNLYGHDGAIYSVAWSPDGTLLASGGADRVVKLWDASGFCVKTFVGHHLTINSVSWSPEGAYVTSASSDDAVITWHVRLLDLIPQFDAVSNILTFEGKGRRLDNSTKVQVFRAGDGLSRQWLDCEQVQLLGSATRVTGSILITAPGPYGFAFYDRFHSLDTSRQAPPWINSSTLFSVNCPNGTEVRHFRDDNASCATCPNAKYSTASLESCRLCTGDVYDNRSTCRLCPLYSSFNGNNCVCNPGYFPSNQSMFLECEICPLHGACDGLALRAADDYWQTLDNTRVFYSCSNHAACKSGVCVEGYEGYLCGQCQPGFGQSARQCQKCPTPVESGLTLFGAILASFIVFVIFVYLSIKHVPGQNRLGLSAIKVALSAAQVNAMLPGLGVRLTENMQVITGLQLSVQNIGVDLLSWSCAYLNYGLQPDDVFFATSLMWLLVGPVFCLGYAVIRLGCRARKREVPLRKFMITSWCCFVFTFHPLICLHTFQLFVCRPVDAASTLYHLSADPAIECFTTRHYEYVFLVGVPLLVCYVILPPVAALLYLRNKTVETNEIQFMCSEFDEKVRWWFVVVLSRKVIIAFLIAAVANNSYLQGLLTTMSLLVYFAAQCVVSPYASSIGSINFAESFSLFLSICLFLIASLVFLNPSAKSLQEGVGVFMSLLTIVFYLGIALLVGKDVVAQMRKKANKHLNKAVEMNDEVDGANRGEEGETK